MFNSFEKYSQLLLELCKEGGREEGRTGEAEVTFRI